MMKAALNRRFSFAEMARSDAGDGGERARDPIDPADPRDVVVGVHEVPRRIDHHRLNDAVDGLGIMRAVFAETRFPVVDLRDRSVSGALENLRGVRDGPDSDAAAAGPYCPLYAPTPAMVVM